jgi:hypothetical protein
MVLPLWRGDGINFSYGADISNSPGAANNLQQQILSPAAKQNWAAAQGWTFNKYRHSSKPSTLYASLLTRCYSSRLFKIS